MASAATVTPEARCWANNAAGLRLTFRGDGFLPGLPLRVTVGGRPVTFAAPPRADLAGGARIAFDIPGLPAGERQRVFRLTLSDGTRTATTPPFGITRFDARYVGPTSSLPADAKVRFRVDGFVGGGATAYLHYVQPNGRLRTTIALGPVRGPCAQLTTPLRKLFPFGNVTPGGWVLRFDTRPVYRPRATVPFRERIVNVTERLTPLR